MTVTSPRPTSRTTATTTSSGALPEAFVTSPRSRAAAAAAAGPAATAAVPAATPAEPRSFLRLKLSISDSFRREDVDFDPLYATDPRADQQRIIRAPAPLPLPRGSRSGARWSLAA